MLSILLSVPFAVFSTSAKQGKKLQDRMRGHRSDIKCKRIDENHPVAAHFNEPSHSTFIDHFNRVWTVVKNGVIGCKICVKRGSLYRQMISADI